MADSGIFAGIRERSVAQVMLVYAAGAWAVVEVVGFLAETYGWARDIVDLSVLLASSGAAVALTLAWYHGRAGKQVVTKSEKIILTVISALTLVAGIGLLLRDPDRGFDKLEGHRIIIEFPVSALNEMKLSWRPEAGNFATEDGAVLLAVEKAEFEVPGVEFTSLGAPVRLQAGNVERPRITIVLPQRPQALLPGRLNPTPSDPLVIESLALLLNVHTDAVITAYVDSTLIVLPAAGGGSGR